MRPTLEALNVTHRQRELVIWTADGVPHREMADWLGLSERTVRREIAALRQLLAGRGLELRQPMAPAQTRHRNLSPELLRDL